MCGFGLAWAMQEGDLREKENWIFNAGWKWFISGKWGISGWRGCRQAPQVNFSKELCAETQWTIKFVWFMAKKIIRTKTLQFLGHLFLVPLSKCPAFPTALLLHRQRNKGNFHCRMIHMCLYKVSQEKYETDYFPHEGVWKLTTYVVCPSLYMKT